MGIWNTSIWGDDVAQDLKLQLKDAYAFNDDETALSEIFRVNESILADETDEDYTVFYYALADWLWDKGRLPENIKQKVLDMLERKEGLDCFYVSNNQALIQKRLEVLAALKEKLQKEQPKRKAIRANIVKPIYNVGDIFLLRVVAEEDDCGTYKAKLDKTYNNPAIFVNGEFKQNPYPVATLNKVFAFLCVGIYESAPAPNGIKGVKSDAYSLFVQYDYCDEKIPTVEELKKCSYVPNIRVDKYEKIPESIEKEPYQIQRCINIDKFIEDGYFDCSFLHADRAARKVEVTKGKYQLFEEYLLGNCAEEIARFNNRTRLKREKDSWNFGSYTNWLFDYCEYKLLQHFSKIE